MSFGQDPDGPPTRTRMPEGHLGPGTAGRRPQPRRALVTVVSVVVVLIAALAFATRGGGSSSSSDDAGGGTDSGTHVSAGHSTATAPSGTAPVTTKADGIPSGFPHTAQGAQSAAANYAVALGGTDMFDTAARHRIVSDLYTPQATAALQGQLDQAYSSSAIRALGLNADGTAPQGLTFVSRTVPVGTKVTAQSADAATVEVWCTALSGLAGQGSTKPVTTSWFTITEKLVWTAAGGGDWKIGASSQKEGPAPVSGDQQVATADQIAGAVQQYGGFTYAR
jgi:hypothetical protein